MSEHQRNTEFLTHLISYDDTPQRRDLAGNMARLQRDARCVRRAVWLMVLLASLAAAGLCYGAIFLVGSVNFSQFASQLVIKIFSVMGLGSIICLVAFLLIDILYQIRLARHREECRGHAMRLVESRLGKPPALASSHAMLD
jgi:hypothetical protein